MRMKAFSSMQVFFDITVFELHVGLSPNIFTCRYTTDIHLYIVHVDVTEIQCFLNVS